MNKCLPSWTSSPAVRSPKTWENFHSSGCGGLAWAADSAPSSPPFISSLFKNKKKSFFFYDPHRVIKINGSQVTTKSKIASYHHHNYATPMRLRFPIRPFNIQQNQTKTNAETNVVLCLRAWLMFLETQKIK